MLPLPKIVVVDDDLGDVQAIIAGLYSLGTAALGLHYSLELERIPQFPGLRILFLDLHLTGSGGDIEQQIKTTIGILSELLAENCGPYVVVLWSSHISEGLALFQSEAEKRLPLLSRPLPLQVLSLDKAEFITTQPDGKRQVDEPAKLRERIINHIKACPQLAALLSWEEDVSRAADEAISQIFNIARQRPVSDEIPLPKQVNCVLGDLAVASVGYPNASSDAFRGVNDVLVQVVTDRLQHRSTSSESSNMWKEAVTEFRKKSDMDNNDAGMLNNFLHVESGAIIKNVTPLARGSITDLSGLSKEQFTDVWGAAHETLLKEFCLSAENTPNLTWVMVQVQPPCDYAQKNTGLLPYLLGLKITNLSTSKTSEIEKKKCLWMSPPLIENSNLYRLVFHLRFLASFTPTATILQAPVLHRFRDQIMAELTHTLTGYSGRPGIIKFPGR